MSTALTPTEPTRAVTAPLAWTRDQIDLVKRTVCRGATDDELAMFMHVCKRTGLDPFARQIHAIKRWDSALNREVMVIQTGIDGYRLIAERTNERDGMDGPYWCGPDGAWVEVWLHQDPPSAAKVLIYRKGHARPYVGVVRYKASVQRQRDGKPNRMWTDRDAEQLAKCAEAAAYRAAFPAELSGVYTDEEMALHAAEEDGRSDQDAKRAERRQGVADLQRKLHEAQGTPAASAPASPPTTLPPAQAAPEAASAAEPDPEDADTVPPATSTSEDAAALVERYRTAITAGKTVSEKSQAFNKAWNDERLNASQREGLRLTLNDQIKALANKKGKA